MDSREAIRSNAMTRLASWLMAFRWLREKFFVEAKVFIDREKNGKAIFNEKQKATKRNDINHESFALKACEKKLFTTFESWFKSN